MSDCLSALELLEPVLLVLATAGGQYILARRTATSDRERRNDDNAHELERLRVEAEITRENERARLALVDQSAQREALRTLAGQARELATKAARAVLVSDVTGHYWPDELEERARELREFALNHEADRRDLARYAREMADVLEHARGRGLENIEGEVRREKLESLGITAMLAGAKAHLDAEANKLLLGGAE